ncbi:MAG: hypothetical protein OSB58_06750 [Alphaproteobacteria bacterium]|jgi:hypothetical protein|nr:hypothetical protein [Alphaproteobacteria bacterium]
MAGMGGYPLDWGGRAGSITAKTGTIHRVMPSARDTEDARHEGNNVESRGGNWSMSAYHPILLKTSALVAIVLP